MGIKEGLLALLARGEAHGYQLKLDLEAATGDTWRINVGQIYTTLSRLERDGLVRSAGADNQGRIIYEITADGNQAVAEWLAVPVDLAAAGRDEISLKLLVSLAAGMDPGPVVKTQRSATMKALQDYTALKGSGDRPDLAWELHLDRLILSAEAELRWLDRVEDRLLTRSGIPDRKVTESRKVVSK